MVRPPPRAWRWAERSLGMQAGRGRSKRRNPCVSSGPRRTMRPDMRTPRVRSLPTWPARRGRGLAGAGPRRGLRVPGSIPQCARGAQLQDAARIPAIPKVDGPQGMSPLPRLLAIAVLALSLGSRALSSQGITSAALQGRVLQPDSTPIHGAVVSVTAAASGARWQVVTDAAGRYFVENVQVGGPYVIEARAVGFKPAGQNRVMLGLGQRYRADFVLEPGVVELPELTVSASADQLLNSGRTGPAHFVPESELAALPNLARDLNVAAALGPLAAPRPFGGISIGGQNQGVNSLQVDGGVSADLYFGRTPGGAFPSGAFPEVLPHAISLETVSEFQVLAAP